MAYIPPHRRGKQGTTKSSHDIAEKHEPVKCEGTGGENQEDDAVTLLCSAFTQIYCINLNHRRDRWDSFYVRMQRSLGKQGQPFIDKVRRYDAVSGDDVLAKMSMGKDSEQDIPCLMDWDATKNSLYDRHIQPPMQKVLSAGEVGCTMSHVNLWRKAVESEDENTTMLILEDDAVFYDQGKRRPKHHHQSWRGMQRGSKKDQGCNEKEGKKSFYTVFSSMWEKVPKDWDILYLGFSDRGERVPIDTITCKRGNMGSRNSEVIMFRPTYGFHTHAYALTQKAASILLENLPVVGPLDVWLADNDWFNMNVYCCVIAGEGWRGTGSYLISQQKYKDDSDINQSGRV